MAREGDPSGPSDVENGPLTSPETGLRLNKFSVAAGNARAADPLASLPFLLRR